MDPIHSRPDENHTDQVHLIKSNTDTVLNEIERQDATIDCKESAQLVINLALYDEDERQNKAGSSFLCFAEQDQNHQAIFENHDCLCALMILASHQGSAIQVRALGILNTLARDKEKHEALLNKGIIQIIVTILTSEPPIKHIKNQHLSAHIYLLLAENINNHRFIRNAPNGFEVLSFLLTREKIARQVATEKISALAENKMKNGKKLPSKFAEDVLNINAENKVIDGDKHTRQFVADALRFLAKNKDNHVAIFKAQIIESLPTPLIFHIPEILPAIVETVATLSVHARCYETCNKELFENMILFLDKCPDTCSVLYASTALRNFAFHHSQGVLNQDVTNIYTKLHLALLTQKLKYSFDDQVQKNIVHILFFFLKNQNRMKFFSTTNHDIVDQDSIKVLRELSEKYPLINDSSSVLNINYLDTVEFMAKSLRKILGCIDAELTEVPLAKKRKANQTGDLEQPFSP